MRRECCCAWLGVQGPTRRDTGAWVLEESDNMGDKSKRESGAARTARAEARRFGLGGWKLGESSASQDAPRLVLLVVMGVWRMMTEAGEGGVEGVVSVVCVSDGGGPHTLWSLVSLTLS